MEESLMTKRKNSRSRSQQIAYYLALASFVAPIFYYLIELIIGTFDSANMLTMLQCVLGVVVLHVPDFLSEKLRFEIPPLLYIFYLIFLYCSITLGEFYDIFNRVPFWDVILHCSSSLVSGFLGFMFVAILNKSEKIMFHLSPIFVSLFAFCFAITIGTVWEIYEYTVDGLLGLNMQKFITPDGTVLIGHAAIVDTMEDLMIDAFGGLAASIIGYFSLKHNKSWLVPKLLDPKPRKAEKKALPISEEPCSITQTNSSEEKPSQNSSEHNI